jgi:hypothetical protein
MLPMINADLTKIVTTLARPRYLIQYESGRQFDALRHTLNHLSRDSVEVSKLPSPDEVTKQRIRRLLKNLILECTPKAPLLVEVMLKLGEAEQRLEDNRIDLMLQKLEEVRAELKALEEAPRDLIYELCSDHSHPEGYVQFILNEWSMIDHYKPYSPPLLFDLGDLRIVVAALRANAHRPGKDPSPCCLRYEEFLKDDTQTAVVTWLEHTERKEWFEPGRLARDSFKIILEGIKKSADKKGLHRGLPQVMLFGIENEAKEAELLINGQWLSLWPEEAKQIIPEKDLLPIESGFEHIKPNYGWRFIFQLKKDERKNKVLLQEELLQGDIASDDISSRTVFLIDDDKNARWPLQIKRYLTSAADFSEEEVILLLPEEAELFEDWHTRIVSHIQNTSKKFDIITDSTFDDDLKGGENLLYRLADKNLTRGIVYSEYPQLDQTRFQYSPNVTVRELRKNEINSDAALIEHFLRTGELNPLVPLIEMMRRFALSMKILLDTSDKPPWALFKKVAPDKDEWRKVQDPWRSLTQGLGDSVLIPFSPYTWRLFTDNPFQEVIQNRFWNNGIRDNDFTDSLIKAIRQALCPVDSIVQAVNSSNSPKPWRDEDGIGSLRVIWDLAVNENEIDDEKFESWATKEKANLGHREVGLKYHHYLSRYRKDIVLQIVPEDWKQIISGAQRQIGSIQKFLTIWDS